MEDAGKHAPMGAAAYLEIGELAEKFVQRDGGELDAVLRAAVAAWIASGDRRAGTSPGCFVAWWRMRFNGQDRPFEPRRLAKTAPEPAAPSEAFSDVDPEEQIRRQTQWTRRRRGPAPVGTGAGFSREDIPPDPTPRTGKMVGYE